MSDIRVSVQWKNSTVFAGEDIECTITFKNTSLARSVRRSQSPKSRNASQGLHRERWKESLPVRSVHASASAKHPKSPSFSGFPQTNARSHKQALSIGNVNGLPKSPTDDVCNGISNTTSLQSYKHRRSVSIVSICGEANAEASRHDQSLNSGRRHTRATSLYGMPWRNGLLSQGSSPGNPRSA